MDKEGIAFVKQQNSGANVNPFLSRMFFKISFKTWLNLARKKMREEEQEEMIARGMAKGKNDEEDLNDGFEEVEIELEPIEVEYTSDEEDDDLTFTASRKNRLPFSPGVGSESQMDEDDSASLIKEKTPADHRRRIKAQKMFASRRFSDTHDMMGMMGSKIIRQDSATFALKPQVPEEATPGSQFKR